MPPKTPAQKRAQLNWIAKNKETYDEKQRIFTLNYYYANREELLAKKKIYYQNKKKQQLETVTQVGGTETTI
jgi:hypothetical protein